jgi:hypothetical protein
MILLRCKPDSLIIITTSATNTSNSKLTIIGPTYKTNKCIYNTIQTGETTATKSEHAVLSQQGKMSRAMQTCGTIERKMNEIHQSN